jgi:hypothetical protein
MFRRQTAALSEDRVDRFLEQLFTRFNGPEGASEVMFDAIMAGTPNRRMKAFELILSVLKWKEEHRVEAGLMTESALSQAIEGEIHQYIRDNPSKVIQILGAMGYQVSPLEVSN